MNTDSASTVIRRGLKWTGALTLCLGLVCVSATASYYEGVEGSSRPDQASGYFSPVPQGAGVSVEASSNGGTASLTVSGPGVSFGATVSGAADVYSPNPQTTNSAGGVSYDLYADGGNSYAVVSVYW